MRKQLQKYIGRWVGLAILVVVAGCSSFLTSSDGKSQTDWIVAYTSDFKDGRATRGNWLCNHGEIKVADGKMTVAPDKRKWALVFLDTLSFPRSQRVEVVGSVEKPEKPEYANINICLNTDGAEYGSGYLLQLGAKGNTCCLLQKKGETIRSTINTNLHLEAGKSYRIVAEKIGSRVSLTVDGMQMFAYDDPAPLEDPTRGNIGLFSWAGSMTIEKVTVYTRKGHPEDVVLPVTAPAGSPEVTLKGILMFNSACVPDPANAGNYQVLYAMEGTPEISAAWEMMMKECWPGDSLDCDQAIRLNEAATRNVKYYLAPGQSGVMDKRCEGQWANPPAAVTGVIAEKDGKKWIIPSKMSVGKKATSTYPVKMLMPDKPLAMPGKEPLILKVDDKLSLKCILLPAGRYLQGRPFYQRRYQDDYPHEVVLTKPFFLAEIPVTQEMYESVVGNNPSRDNSGCNVGPQCPVEHAPFADIETFCRILSEKNKRKVRLPTNGEFEYAGRVGTSSPSFTEKYKDQISNVGADAGDGKDMRNCPVKSARPNAWGLYDMLTCAEQVVSDWAGANARAKEIDSIGPPRSTYNYGGKPMHRALSSRWFGIYLPGGTGAVNLDGQGAEAASIFRVAVEATPEEIAEMEKEEKK